MLGFVPRYGFILNKAHKIDFEIHGGQRRLAKDFQRGAEGTWQNVRLRALEHYHQGRLHGLQPFAQLGIAVAKKIASKGGSPVLSAKRLVSWDPEARGSQEGGEGGTEGQVSASACGPLFPRPPKGSKKLSPRNMNP